MKKLQKINFNKCDALSQKQLNTLRGGRDTATVCHCETNCGSGDIGYEITYEDGSRACGMIMYDEILADE
ncbi:MAG: TIGR04149 family rSAM-modified RiPP [Bacteroidales bacterium]|nr:TIGR04149 family rSAM-modified RiPP [Bacteroidales bacterium]